jgi:hypothetical protein
LVVGQGWRLANSVVTVLPMITALAVRHSATQAASPNGTLPSKIAELWPVGMSCVSMMSFTPTGTPRSTPPLAASAARACFSGKGRIEMDPRLHDRIALGDAVEAGLHQLLGGERAGLDRPGGFGGAERLHCSAPCTQAAMSSSRASSCCGRPAGCRPAGRSARA